MCLGACLSKTKPINWVYYGGVYYGYYTSVVSQVHKKQYDYSGQLDDEDVYEPHDLIEDGQADQPDWGWLVGIRAEFAKSKIFVDLGYNSSFDFSVNKLDTESALSLTIGYRF
jgi:hypothetical protein